MPSLNGDKHWSKQMGSLGYEIEVDGQVYSAHIDHLKPWPIKSLPSSEPLSDGTPSDILSAISQSGSNDNSKTALFLAPAYY